MIRNTSSIVTNLLLLITVLLSCPVQAESMLTIYTENPDLQHSEGSPSGFVYEMVRQIMRRTQVETKIQVENWKRSYLKTINGTNAAIFPTTRTPDREELFHWVGPILRVRWALYAKTGSQLKITNLEDAKRVGRIGTYAEDAREQFLKDEGFTNLESVHSIYLNWRMLYADRVDLVAGSDMSLNQSMQSGEFPSQAFEKVLEIKTVDLYLAFSKNTDPYILEAWKQGLTELLKESTLQSLQKQWFARQAEAH